MNEPECVYSSGYSPDPASARDVLAFVLTPVEALAPASDEDDIEAVEEMLDSAKLEAIKRWFDLVNVDMRN